MSEVFLESDTVNKCIQPCLPISAIGNHVYTCTEIAQEHYVLLKLLLCPLPLSTNPTTVKAWESQGYFSTGLKLHKCSMFGCHGSVCSVALSTLLLPPPFWLFFAPLIFSWVQIAMGAPFSSKSLEKCLGAENDLLE